MTIYLPPGKSAKWYMRRYRWRKWVHGLRRNPDCNERRRYRNDTMFVSTGKHIHKPPLWQGGYRFEQVSVPFEPFRIETRPDVRKEDLMYLRVNTVEQSQDPDEQRRLIEEDEAIMRDMGWWDG